MDGRVHVVRRVTPRPVGRPACRTSVLERENGDVGHLRREIRPAGDRKTASRDDGGDGMESETM